MLFQRVIARNIKELQNIIKGFAFKKGIGIT